MRSLDRCFFSFHAGLYFPKPTPVLVFFFVNDRQHSSKNTLKKKHKVREKALESIQTVARCLSAEQLTDHMVPLLSRLTLKEWFTARMSACCLAPSTYALLVQLLPPKAAAAAAETAPAAPAPAAGGGDREAGKGTAADAAGEPGAVARAQVRELFKKLCTDDTPMVRR